jgi:hypothetical protein
MHATNIVWNTFAATVTLYDPYVLGMSIPVNEKLSDDNGPIKNAKYNADSIIIIAIVSWFKTKIGVRLF